MRVTTCTAALGVILVGCGDCPVTGGAAPATSTRDAPVPAPATAPRAGDPESPAPKLGAPADCGDQILDGDRIDHKAPARRTLYTWTTDEQIGSLRSSKQLFAGAAERPAAATAVLATLATIAGKELPGELFARTRSTWPIAWATRLVAPGQRLLRINLRAEALVVSFRKGELEAVDMENRAVALRTVIDHPERIGAIYFVQEEVAPVPCSSTTSSSVTCATAQGYREVLVGNEAMIEEWSSDTEPIRAELARERALLARLLAEKRSSLPATPSPTWSSAVLDDWSIQAFLYPKKPCAETEGYRSSLAIPNADYEPTARNLARIIDTLDAAPPPLPAEELLVRPTKESK